MKRYKRTGKQQMKSQSLKFKGLVYAVVAAFALVLLTFNFSWAATAAKHYTELEFAPLPEIKLPKYERYMLDNGMVVYLMENHELPLVNGAALIGTGDRFEPSDKVGLAQMVGTVMRTGGTRSHTPDELNQMLEQRAASVETDINETSGNASFEALSEDVELYWGCLLRSYVNLFLLRIN